MQAKVWVGRVKSNCPPEYLEDAFCKIGKLIKVETGFAGFAFVDYENEDDADEACKQMNKAIVPNVGEVRVSRATQRGYEDACQKRDAYNYQKSKGPIGQVWQCGDRGSRGLMGRRSRSRSRRSRKSSCSRSYSRRRQRARHSLSRSASYGRSRGARGRQSPSRGRDGKARSRSKSRSKARSPSKSRSRSKSLARPASPASRGSRPRSTSRDARRSSRSPEAPPPEPPLVKLAEQDSAGRAPLEAPKVGGQKKAREESPGKRKDASDWLALPVAEGRGNQNQSSALATYETEQSGSGGSGCLSPAERGRVVTFFDGASLRELLLESAAVLAVPDLFVHEILNGFPHSFQTLSQESVINLLAVLGGFIRGTGGGAEPPPADLVAEVRQTLTFNSRGQRIMRKTILVDGVTCASEEQML